MLIILFYATFYAFMHKMFFPTDLCGAKKLFSEIFESQLLLYNELTWTTELTSERDANQIILV